MRTRSADPGSRRVLRDGPRVPGFRATVWIASEWRVLRHPRQAQHEFPARALRTHRSQHGTDLRSERHTQQFLRRSGLPGALRRVRYKDPRTQKSLAFLTNHFGIPALSVCALYKSRWQVELFFKWIKQHLPIKRFFGTSENAVKSQVWIAVATYVLVAIVRKRLKLDLSLHAMLQVLSVTPFEKIPLIQLFSDIEENPNRTRDASQLILL